MSWSMPALRWSSAVAGADSIIFKTEGWMDRAEGRAEASLGGAAFTFYAFDDFGAICVAELCVAPMRRKVT